MYILQKLLSNNTSKHYILLSYKIVIGRKIVFFFNILNANKNIICVDVEFSAILS